MEKQNEVRNFFANEQGLLLCWNLNSSGPELKPIRITDDEDKN